jgi:hypothetical protein
MNDPVEIELEWRIILNLSYILIAVNSDSKDIMDEINGICFEIS